MQIKDYSSINGTFVNNVPISRIINLQGNDKIGLGVFFRDEESPNYPELYVYELKKTEVIITTVNTSID